MVLLAMGGRWNACGFKLSYLTLLIILYDVHGSSSLNSEGNSMLGQCYWFSISVLAISSSFCPFDCSSSLTIVDLKNKGLALLGFRSKVDSDPYGVLANWNPDHCDPCLWSGVQCLAGKVQIL